MKFRGADKRIAVGWAVAAVALAATVAVPQASGHGIPIPEQREAAMEMWTSLHGIRPHGLSRQAPSSAPRRASGSQLRAVPKATCGPEDLPETALQGQVPWVDRISGRAAKGYSCNLEVVSRYADHGFANLDSYKNCAYYTDNVGGFVAEGDGVVLDLSDPTHPVETARLTARAMGNGGESLRVNQARGLLVADHYSNFQIPGELYRTLAVYDLTRDCRKPELLADVVMPTAVGHEGCFAPDGMVYYMASAFTITPIDLSNPRAPKQLSEPWALPIHGCSISDDGKRGYFARIDLTGIAAAGSAAAGMLTVDTSQVQARRADAAPRSVSLFKTPDGQFQQSTIPLTYGGRPYVLDWPEAVDALVGSTPLSRCVNPASVSNFAYPRILDMADEAKPREVSKILKEVDLPENCLAVAADFTNHTLGLDRGDPFFLLASKLFMYDSHYCRTDRLHDPTVAACAEFGAGLRVFDIRDPEAPKEIAYYNPGTMSRTDPTVDFVAAPPVIRRDLGQIWMVSVLKGFHVLQFREGVWPFKDADRCPGSYDYAADQYDLEYRGCLAAREQTVAPVPNAIVSLSRTKNCRSARRLQVRIGQPTVGALRRVRVFVNGKRVRDLRGGRIRSVITVRTPRRGRYTIRVVARTAAGKTIVKTRTYRACTRR